MIINDIIYIERESFCGVSVLEKKHIIKGNDQINTLAFLLKLFTSANPYLILSSTIYLAISLISFSSSCESMLMLT